MTEPDRQVGSEALIEGGRPRAGFAEHGRQGGRPPSDQDWSRAFLFAPALTIGGGTTEVQKNILAQRVLGLPRGS